MKIATKILIQIYLLNVLSAFQQQKIVKDFQCNLNNSSLSVNLKNEQILNQSNSFGVTFWMSYVYGNVFTLFTFDSLYSKIIIGIGNQNRLSLNSELLSISSIKGSPSQNEKIWNFVYIHFNGKNDKANMTIALNDQIVSDKELEFLNWQNNLYLILGSSEVFSPCKLNADFRNVIVYNKQEPFNKNFLFELSTGKLEPVFLSKMNQEPSYNKYYENLIQNEIGPIKNGVSTQTNAFYTAVASRKNIYQNRQHLVSDLSIYLMPRGLLDPSDINQSYVFLMHYKLYYTDFITAQHQNLQLFPLYQRYSVRDIKVLIRADIQVKLGNKANKISSRYFINEIVQQELDYPIGMTQTNNLNTVPLQYLMIQVESNPYFNNPRVTFRNGQDQQDYQFSASVQLSPYDRHLFGDNEKRNTTRKEYFSFVTIEEVAFFRGALISKITDPQQDVKFYSGFDDNDRIILTCRENFNIQRRRGNNIVFDTCERDSYGICVEQGNNVLGQPQLSNCDICINNICSICNPGYELDLNNQCVRCQRGYDSFLKRCFDGNEINEFFDIQFQNLKSTNQNITLTNGQYIAVTAQNELNLLQYSKNGILFFYQNLDNETRLLDICFLKTACQPIQNLHFSLLNVNEKNPQDLNIDYFVLGNTGDLASTPQRVYYSIKNQNDFDINGMYYKNFNCQIFGNFYMLQEDTFYGQCVSECPNGYYADQNYQRCMPCASNCLQCENNQTCNNCQEGYFLQNGECQKCLAPCQTCQGGPQRCTSCFNQEQFDIENNTCNRLCRNKIQNCNNCDYQTGKCLSCIFRYTLMNNVCELTYCEQPNCDQCDQPKICTKCSRGYVANLVGFCEICQSNCEACPQGYQLRDQQCFKENDMNNQQIKDRVVNVTEVNTEVSKAFFIITNIIMLYLF